MSSLLDAAWPASQSQSPWQKVVIKLLSLRARRQFHTLVQVNTFQLHESDPLLTLTGIQISPNSSRILRKLGIDKYIEKHCVEPVDLRMMRWRNGKILVECPLKEPAHNEYGSPYWYISRRRFLDNAKHSYQAHSSR